ncbi:MAG TPA: SDR family NAD(P)-dependent oxidoreductase [bacterium]|nr:SDR family NAD(P)-dependent oxidoreductase [bacterium]
MSENPFQGKVAIVTGASRGIGEATARLLAERGAAVTLVSRGRDPLNQVADRINADRGRRAALAVCGDVGSEATWKDAFQAASEAFGAVDILVNAAGLFRAGSLADTELDEWEEVLAANLRGSFLGCRAMFRQAGRLQRPGSIVNISSLGGIRSTEKFPGMAAYVVSKHGIVGLTEIAAVEGKTLGIRVNAVAPGAVATEMLRQAAPFLKTKTQPEDVAKAIAFLCDETQSGKVSGSVLEIFSNE